MGGKKKKVSDVRPSEAGEAAAGSQAAIQNLRSLNNLLVKETVQHREEIKQLRSEVVNLRQANAELGILKERLMSMEQANSQREEEMELLRAENRAIASEACGWTNFLLPFAAIVAAVGTLAYVTRN